MPIDRQRNLSSKALGPLALTFGFLVRLGYQSSRAWMAYLAPDWLAIGVSGTGRAARADRRLSARRERELRQLSL